MQGAREALFMITLASHGYLFVGKGIVQAGIWGTSTSLSESAPNFDNRNRESPQKSEEPSKMALKLAGLESLQDT